jgi:AcrR family transcriptional regulator
MRNDPTSTTTAPTAAPTAAPTGTPIASASGDRAGDTRLPRNAARAALVEAALTHLAVDGPAGVHPHELCHELGLSKALVNYHFGSRDGLIAEAMATGYERYVEGLWTAAQAAGPEPFDRLLAWIDAQIAWTVANAGLAAALNFPRFAAGTASEQALPVSRMTTAGVRNFQTLQGLVADARRAVRPDVGDDDPIAIALDASVVGWATLGCSVWLAGNHLPTRVFAVSEHIAMAREHLRATLVRLLGG